MLCYVTLTSGRRITDAHCGIAAKHLLMCDSIESLRRACKWPRTSTPLMNINGASAAAWARITGHWQRSTKQFEYFIGSPDDKCRPIWNVFFVADSSWQIALPAVIYTIVLARTDSADSPDCLPALLSNSVLFYLFVLLSTKGRRFDSWPLHVHVTTFGKLFAHSRGVTQPSGPPSLS